MMPSVLLLILLLTLLPLMVLVACEVVDGAMVVICVMVIALVVDLAVVEAAGAAACTGRLRRRLKEADKEGTSWTPFLTIESCVATMERREQRREYVVLFKRHSSCFLLSS